MERSKKTKDLPPFFLHDRAERDLAGSPNHPKTFSSRSFFPTKFFEEERHHIIPLSLAREYGMTYDVHINHQNNNTKKQPNIRSCNITLRNW
jgi:hypothetical protein